jgi:hypothetical protein
LDRLLLFLWPHFQALETKFLTEIKPCKIKSLLRIFAARKNWRDSMGIGTGLVVSSTFVEFWAVGSNPDKV